MKWAKRITSMAVAAVLLGTLAGQPVLAGEAPGDSAKDVEAIPTTGAGGSKEEVVYANLAFDGAVDSLYVVNQFDVKTAGSLTDYGDYTGVSNLTSTRAMDRQGDAVSVPVEKGEFYYQGNLATRDLPWTLAIAYRLDGREIGAEDLAGRSGALEIAIKTKQNKNVDATFYDNYMLQISLTLDTARCQNIVSENATVASAGKNKVVAHTVMPGKDADILLTADVADFEMAGIEIAGMPFSMPIDIPETDEVTGEMMTLAEAISAVNDGVGQLSDGIATLNEGVEKLAGGSGDFAAGLEELNANSRGLTDGSAEIGAALDLIAGQLSGQGMEGLDLSQLAQLPENLRQMAGGLTQLSGGMTTLQGGYAAMYGALDAAIMAIPALTQADIQALAGALAASGLPADQQSKLLDACTASQVARGTYLDASQGSSIKDGMGAVSGSLATMAGTVDTLAAGLSAMADGIESTLSGSDLMDQLGQLQGGMTLLADMYGQFHEGLLAYTDGVAQMAEGYGELDSGISALAEGTGEMAEGAAQLHEGTTELDDAVAGLPDTIQEEIDKLIGDYDKSDFEAVSFTSPKNKNTTAVQFVLMTGSIQAPAATAETVDADTKGTLLDRFIALFT